jgi:hypothetical protein
MTEIREWIVLPCDCGGEIFQQVVKLKFRTGAGVVPEPAGYVCQACHGLADNQRLVRLQEVAHLRRQIKETEAEIESKTDATTSRGALPKVQQAPAER